MIDNGQCSVFPCEMSLYKGHVSDKSFLRKLNLCKGTGWRSSLVYLAHKNKHTIELNGHLESELPYKEWPITVFDCANGMFVTIAPLEN